MRGVNNRYVDVADGADGDDDDAMIAGILLIGTKPSRRR